MYSRTVRDRAIEVVHIFYKSLRKSGEGGKRRAAHDAKRAYTYARYRVLYRMVQYGTQGR